MAAVGQRLIKVAARLLIKRFFEQRNRPLDYFRFPRWTLFSVSKQIGSRYCFEIVINFGSSSFSA